MPYYLNIAPNRDLTFYPRLVGRRGVQVGSDLRLLGQEYYTEVGLQVLPSDKIAGKIGGLEELPQGTTYQLKEVFH